MVNTKAGVYENMSYTDEDFITEALSGNYDVVCYSRNCLGKINGLRSDYHFNLHFPFAQFMAERGIYKLDPNKLGNIVYKDIEGSNTKICLMYDHFHPNFSSTDNANGPILDMDAFAICCKKINSVFQDSTILFSEDNFIELCNNSLEEILLIMEKNIPDCTIVISCK